ncbi:uncharacterized protein LOC123525451 isoform X2 [Mercenaria mercenaria]|nr:uncharacterized protein LOC123525451 isoform X2 [Mercenaria mercenaria]
MSGRNKMVLMTPMFGFFENTLDNMERMRDETWSDITLKVGCRSLYAHRLVLAVHSGYFKTLFLSNFSDSKSKEIDLSPVVTDIDILEVLVKYMYCGKIECEKKDFWEVARLASYLEMKVLMSMCEKWMIKQVTLNNCVEYYVFANTHGYRKAEDLAYKIIEPRFHDYIVFQDSALVLKPKDVIPMLDSGFFKNCGNASFLEFLGNWVAKGCTDQHVEVAKEVLEYLDQEIESDFTVTAHKTPMKSLEECCHKLESKLSYRDTKDDKDLAYSFLKEFKRLVLQIQEAKEIPIDDEENVVFTLCERKKKQMLVGPGTKVRFTSSIGTKKKVRDSVYDIYLFREHSNCWYHIDTVESHPNWCSKKTLPFHRKNNDCFVLNKTLVFVRKNSKHAMKFDLEKKEWSEFKLPSVQRFGETLSDIGNEFAVCNEELYVVFTKPDAEPLDERYYHEDNPIGINGCFFEIYKVNIQNGSLSKIATTGLYPLQYDQFESDFLGYEGIRSSAHVQVNKASGDMFVLVYLDEYLGDGCEIFEKYVSFVVNLKDGSTHFFSTETNDQLKYPFHDLYIVEKEDCFLIIHHFEKDTCEIIAEYKFLSKKIVFREGVSKPNPESQDPCEDEPHEGKLYHGGGSGLWYFYGNSDYTCNLKYISVGEVSEKGNANLDENVEQNVTGDKFFKEDGTEDTNAEVDEGKNTESSVDEDRNADNNTNSEFGEESDEENKTEIRRIDKIPLPFTNVKCVCQAKMGKEFISKLEPVKMFLL